MTINLSKEDIAWIAGIIEGEGNFYFRTDHETRDQCRVKVAMTDEDIILRLRDLVPTSTVVSYKRNTPEHAHWKRIYCWHLCDRKMLVEFIPLIIPWLGKRRGQKARDFMEWLEKNPPLESRVGLFEGEKNPSAILTSSDVLNIRTERKAHSLSELSSKYGVSLSTISNICVGKTWKSVAENHDFYKEP